MRANKLLNVKFKNNHVVSLITDNSKECINNAVFVMHKINYKYLDEAIRKGAKTIIFNDHLEVKEDVNLLIVKDTYKVIADALYLMHGKILKKYKFIGITGTNGKTTTSTLLYRYLRSLNYNVLLFGSNGIYMDDLCFETQNTTPSISKIYSFIISNYKKNLFSKFSNKNNYVIIECSSQGIRNHRVKNISFDVVGFTNITHDHLDYHKSVSDYVYSKALLFQYLKKSSKVLINNEDEHKDLLSSISPIEPIYYGIKGNYSYIIKASSLLKNSYSIIDKEQELEFSTSLIGDFQIKNILLVYSILKELNINIINFSKFIKETEHIPGRINYFVNDNKHFIVDYAHTSPAIKTIVEFVKKQNFKKIYIVVGFGGDREKEKRYEMGKYLTENTDLVIFTEDNNRSESFESIMKDVQRDILNTNYLVIPNRYEAIKHVIKLMEPNTILLLIGKGIEKTKVNDQFLTDEMMINKVIYD